MSSQITAAIMSFLCMASELSLTDRVKGSEQNQNQSCFRDSANVLLEFSSTLHI